MASLCLRHVKHTCYNKRDTNKRLRHVHVNLLFLVRATIQRKKNATLQRELIITIQFICTFVAQYAICKTRHTFPLLSIASKEPNQGIQITWL